MTSRRPELVSRATRRARVRSRRHRAGPGGRGGGLGRHLWDRIGAGTILLRRALTLYGDGHPWERARTLQGLALATAEPAEALGWARDSLALFRQVGDPMRVANTLFVIAGRSIDAGVADDEVQGWLAESLALSEAAGSDHERAHALLGFGRLAWLRGDRDRAVQLLEECVPILRRLGDQRCTGRGLLLLGARAREQQQLARAEELLRASVEAAEPAGEATVVIDALEALAAVLAATDHPREAAALSAARTARRNGPRSRPTSTCAGHSSGGWDAAPSTTRTPKADPCPPRRPSVSHPPRQPETPTPHDLLVGWVA